MTRICSQLTNSKLPLQGQKNVEVKEEKNDEKNLYRDISTFHFRNKGLFGNEKIIEMTKISRNQLIRGIDLFEWWKISMLQLSQKNDVFEEA